MAMASSPSLHEAVFNTPQLQLVVLQIFAQLQHERDFVKSENQVYKYHLSRAEDRCRKEQMRRMTIEHQMNEQIGIFQAKTQATLEAAAEVQRLLRKAEEELATALVEANRFKELSRKKDNLLSKLRSELKLLEKSVHITIKDTKVMQDLVKTRKTDIEPSLKQSEEIEEKLRESTKGANQFQRLAEERELKLKTAEGRIEATEKQLQSAKEEIKDLQTALLKASQNVASCEAKYKISVEEAINLKNSMKADKELLTLTWVTGNATVETLKLALEVEKNKTLPKAEGETKQNEREGKCLQEQEKLHQELEMEKTRSLSLQSALDSGFSNISDLITSFADKQEKCQTEKQQLMDKIMEEKRTCEERNSAIFQNVSTVLQELKHITNKNRQLSENVEGALMTDLEHERTLRNSLLAKLSSDIPPQIERIRQTVLSHHQNVTETLAAYIIRPKENLKKLPYILHGRTILEALLTAASNGNLTELQILLDAGANIESYDAIYSETPLIWAAENGRLDACRLLLERGANIQARATEWGNRTSLHAAAMNNKLDILELLIGLGADVTAKDADGKTAAEVGNDNTKAWFKRRVGSS